MKQLRKGFTTGSCAAAASKAAAYMLLSGRIIDSIGIETPAGVSFTAKLHDIKRDEESVTVSVIKDGGDDPDVTSGCHIVSKVLLSDEKEVKIRGGKGIGIVTKEGLDQPVGEYAINSVPREMIKKELSEVAELFDHECGFCVTLSVPEGEEIAKKTFNERLGIEGGISIIGTTGIVEPMSKKALLDTIYLEMKQKHLLSDIILLSPGNMGKDAMKKEYGVDMDDFVKCSNFVGEAVDMAVELSFKGLLLEGHVGKLVKVSGGIMNTHSREADSRLEILSSLTLLSGGDEALSRKILSCTNTEEALLKISEASKDGDLLKKTGELMAERISFYLSKRAGETIEIGCIVCSANLGIIAKSKNAKELLQNG